MHGSKASAALTASGRRSILYTMAQHLEELEEMNVFRSIDWYIAAREKAMISVKQLQHLYDLKVVVSYQ